MSQSGTATTYFVGEASLERLFGEIIRKYVLAVYFFTMYPSWTSDGLTRAREVAMSQGQEPNTDTLFRIGEMYVKRGLRPAIAVTSTIHGIQNWENFSTRSVNSNAHYSLSQAERNPRLLQEFHRGRFAFLGDAVIELVAMEIWKKRGVASFKDMHHLVKSSVANMALQATCIRFGFYQWITRNVKGHEVTEGIEVAKAAYERAKTSGTHWSCWSKDPALCNHSVSHSSAKRKKSEHPHLYKPTADQMEALFGVMYLDSGKDIATVTKAFEHTVVDTLYSLPEPVWNMGYPRPRIATRP
jgi:dsRNA-specific ribonuclease